MNSRTGSSGKKNSSGKLQNGEPYSVLCSMVGLPLCCHWILLLFLLFYLIFFVFNLYFTVGRSGANNGPYPGRELAIQHNGSCTNKT
ncbi:hypothetical protein BDV40DRAFT_281939 [Aspergillus tamarii]|uniref:Uncharacterized protein n=1 Tax=Aspergillus tamarii TaxID=41984 RepID=A0A5N6UC87_ASPTM|nr:hypothetical protein BDV40DRAFT_281939 [Aspergillus tamarii]